MRRRRNGSTRAPRGGARAAALGIAALSLAAAMLPAAPSPAVAASPPDTTETGDPPPPADPTTPDGLDEPSPLPDDSIVEMPPPASPDIVPNANTIRMAWVGTPGERPDDDALLTLQAAINAAPSEGTVSFDPNDYAFTGALTIPRAMTLDSSAASMLYSRFTVSGGGATFADDVSIGAANTGAIVTVTASGATLTGVTIRNPTPVLRPTGVQLGAGVTGVVLVGLDVDGAGEPSSFGVNLTTGSATLTDPTIAGVATGVVATAASTASGIAVEGGTVAAATSGVSLGTSTAPQVSDVDVTGTSGAGTGIDLANSTGAVVDSVTVHGFARGIGASPTSAGAGPTVSDAVIDGSSREGIALGSTTGASVTDARITLAGAAQSTGILTLLATAVTIERPVITEAMYGITTSAVNTGAGPTITDPRITAFGGITLGSTQGASVTGAVLDNGPWTGGTGINTVNAGRVSISDMTATGFLYGIGAQSNLDASSDRANIAISDIRVTGAPNASSGVYLLGAVDATISRVTAELTGAALVIHQSTGVLAQDVEVTGREGPTSVTGGAILRAYGSQDVDVTRSSIDGGSYGFFYSDTDGSTVTDASVNGLAEYGVYGRSVSNVDVSEATFTGNSAVGLFVVTNPDDGISHDVAVHDSTMTDNDGGIHVLQGTTGVSITDNTVSGQPDMVTAGSAHDLTIAGNSVEQTGAAGLAAITVAPLWQDGALPGSYSSSDVEITGNEFAGGGTWIQVGTADPDAHPDEALRRALRDDVLATGNIFPAGSAAIRTYANAVVGEDTAPALARALPVDGPVAVDARDHDDPNDWDSTCKATGLLDDASYYDGGGAEVHEVTEAPVLYPMNCIDLSLTEVIDADDGTVFHAGDLVTWRLTPHNDGPRAAPAGWTITQLLPDGVELVSMEGEGYSVDGTTATAAADLAVGADGPLLTVTAQVLVPPAGESTMRNVAYVAPAPDIDLDEDGSVDAIIEQLSPLVVPTISTDTEATATDNDAQAVWAVEGAPAPEPPGPDDGGADPVPVPDGNDPGPGIDADGFPGGEGTVPVDGGGSDTAQLAATGRPVAPLAVVALLLLGAGAAATTWARRKKATG
ncbi:beta strand repeat-containing protein [Krasilnikoviella flava]|uniref:Right handed beta helix region n=1 Tax=Krasilnikoviella flava TaxID=526729 RepID=A0A1T5K0M0_9MICO|nr:right-handed parallel beta-helix repeat-containing protein [Krasilnikoviella flava]SKC57055.1 Right handed beta helix region [Krasilnikoviella flava]